MFLELVYIPPVDYTIEDLEIIAPITDEMQERFDDLSYNLSGESSSASRERTSLQFAIQANLFKFLALQEGEYPEFVRLNYAEQAFRNLYRYNLDK